MKDFIQVMSIGLALVAVLAFMVFAILHTQDERRCRDALLRPDPLSSASVECEHEQQTLIRDGDLWRCVCPNTRIEGEP